MISLSTVKDVRGANSTFRSVLLVPEDVPSDPEGLNDIRAHANSNWLIREGLISATSPRLAAVLVRLVRGSTDETRAKVVEGVREVLAKHPHSPIRFHVTGMPTVELDSVIFMMNDLQRFVPVTYFMLSALIYLFTQRVAGVALAFVNATLSVVFGAGVLAVFGSPTTLSTILTPMLMVLSVATVVHFLTEYARDTQVQERRQAQGSVSSACRRAGHRAAFNRGARRD